MHLHFTKWESFLVIFSPRIFVALRAHAVLNTERAGKLTNEMLSSDLLKKKKKITFIYVPVYTEATEKYKLSAYL